MRRRRPAIWAAAMFALGLALGRATPHIGAEWWLGAALVFGVGVAIWKGILCRGAMCAAMIALGAGGFALRINEAPADFLGHALRAGDAERSAMTVKIEGVALERPEVGVLSRGRLAPFLAMPPMSRFPLRVEFVVAPDGGSTRVSGTVFVRVGESIGAVRAGDRVRVTGILSGVEPPLNPGESDARLWAAQDRLAGYMQVAGRELVTVLPPAELIADRARSMWLLQTDLLRAEARRLLGETFDEAGRETDQEGDAGRALLGAMILGERDEALRDVQGVFIRLGISHILAISGLHLTLLAAAALLAIRATGDRGRMEPIIIALVVLLYLVVVPARAPIVRASAMVLGYLAAEAACRRYDRLNLLAWIALFVLVWRPMELWAAGFQFSFGVVAALMTLTGPVSERWFGARPDPDTLTRRGLLSRRVKDLFVASFVAWAVSAPCAAHHFGVFSPFAVLTNMVIVPLMMLLLGAAYLVLLVSAALPSVGGVAGPLLASMGEGVLFVAGALDHAPGMAVMLPRIGAAWTVCATVAVVCWLRFGLRRDPLREAGADADAKPRSVAMMRGRLLAGAFLVLAAWLFPSFLSNGLGRDAQLRVDTIAVGDGACHLIRTPGREATLWDCGSGSLTIGERTIPRAVRALGAQRVRTVVISHPNLDHYCALPDIIAPLGVCTVYVGEAFVQEAARRPAGPLAHVLANLERRGVEVRTLCAGDTLDLGAGVTATILSPPRGAVWRRGNDASLVARLAVPTEAGERRMLLTGDIETEAMAALTDPHAAIDIRADAAEAPHHGSARPAAYDFVLRVNPAIVVQSTGRRRLGDERWDEVKASRRWRTTASDGAVSIEFLKDGSVVDAVFRAKPSKR